MTFWTNITKKPPNKLTKKGCFPGHTQELPRSTDQQKPISYNFLASSKASSSKSKASLFYNNHKSVIFGSFGAFWDILTIKDP